MQKPSFLSHFSAVTSSFFFDFFARNLLLVKLSHFQPDITAPDVDIIASYSEGNGPMELPADQRRIPFNVLSSTSMSCPHVSGVISLLKALYLEWTPAVIKSANMTTARTRDNMVNPMVDADYYKATPFEYGPNIFEQIGLRIQDSSMT